MSATNTDDVRRSLIPILEAFRFHSPTQYEFAGETFDTAQTKLEDLLYLRCYMQRFTGKVSPALPAPQMPDAAWVDALSQNNTSSDRYQEGWVIAQMGSNGYLFAQKGSLVKGFWANQCFPKGQPAISMHVGTPVGITMPRESRSIQPGFYFAFGETPGDLYDDSQVVRVYWNVQAQCGPALIRYLSQRLNRYRLPFHFKLPAHPALLNRTDAGTLYVSKRHWPVAALAVEEVYSHVRDGLNAETPLFAKTLAPGLGFAEDPGTGESFGTARCRLLAEGLALGYRHGAQQVKDWIRAVERVFDREQLSLDEPWRKAGSQAEYRFGLEATW
jgi:hypothetical protein